MRWSLAAAQVVKLPAGKYTVREREMLSGVAGAPESYFVPGNAFSNSIIFCERPLPSAHQIVHFLAPGLVCMLHFQHSSTSTPSYILRQLCMRRCCLIFWGPAPLHRQPFGRLMCSVQSCSAPRKTATWDIFVPFSFKVNWGNAGIPDLACASELGGDCRMQSIGSPSSYC